MPTDVEEDTVTGSRVMATTKMITNIYCKTWYFVHLL